MQQDEILIKSEKSQESFMNFKKRMLIIGAIAIPYAFFPFVICGFDADVVADSGILPLFIGISLFWLGIVFLIYWISKVSFENEEWIVTKTGVTQLNKKTGAKTFIPSDHISTVSLVKDSVRITTVDLTRPQGLAFLANAAKMVDVINTLIYTTEKNKDVTINQVNDVADEIAKYKKLFDDGIITQEEFEAKKKQLLGL